MSRGFTLIELVVALLLAVLAATLLFDALRLATRTLERLETRHDAQDVLVATRLLTTEVERARRLSGEPDGLRFLAPAPPRLGGGMYNFSVAIAVAPDGSRLVLSYARQGAGAAERSAVLARGLRFARFEYFGEPPASAAAQWTSRWEAKDGLPRVVRVKLLADGPAAAPHELYFRPRLTGIRPEPPA
jgi:prepilin-type N-terminal cleavage/methylation domain-containing protein